MFDKLKKVVYLKEITYFKSLLDRNKTSEESSEAYLEPKRASTMQRLLEHT